MKILICDDQQHYLQELKDHVQEYMKNRYISCQITATTNPLTIFQSKESYDLALLDIQMDGLDGISLAKNLKVRNPKLVLFFITGYEEYQDEALDLSALRFFEKPFDAQRLYAGLDKAMEYIDGAYVDVHVLERGTTQRLLVDDILYLTREGRKTAVVTKSSRIITQEDYDAWCERLPNLFFYGVHKSFFVNLHYVDKYSYTELFLTDGTRIPIAPRKQAAFHKFWFGYLRRQ